MKAVRAYETNRRLRDGRVWSLLAADKAPTVVALLDALFLQGEPTLTAPVFHARLTRELEYLESTDGRMGRSAQQLSTDWLAKGWVSRHLPQGALEEVFNLTADAQQAIRFVHGLERPHLATTETRLALVMQQVERLAQDTDANLASRLQALSAERERIDRQMAALVQDGVQVLPEDRALERVNEVLQLARSLAVDFQQVREAFEQLNRDVRREFLNPDSTRGEQLRAAFDGKELIDQSEAGRTFDAFWRLLTDAEQSASLVAALDAVTSRDFAFKLDIQDRRFLRNLPATLLAESRQVKTVVQQFGTGLRSFVKSREYRENRHMTNQLREAQHAALAAQDGGNSLRGFGFTLNLSSANVDSISRWRLEDPSQAIEVKPMVKAEPGKLDASAFRQLVESDEINFRELRANLRQALAEVERISVPELLTRFGSTQGLGTVVGYMSLAMAHGKTPGGTETVEWTGPQGQHYRGTIPHQYFTRDCLRSLAT